MKLDMKSFRTRVGRRVFLLFIICAIIPISALALVSYGHVRHQLNEQSRNRLSQQSKNIGVSIYERLVLLRTEMRMAGTYLNVCPDSSAAKLPEGLVCNLKGRFQGLEKYQEGRMSIPIFGDSSEPPRLSREVRRHLDGGEALLDCSPVGEGLPSLRMFLALSAGHPESGVLLGKIDCSFLWGAAEGRPPMTDILVVDRSRNVLFSSFPDHTIIPQDTLRKICLSHSGQFEWRRNGRTFFACSRSINLTTNFLAPPWLVVLSESKDDVFAPTANFKLAFAVIVFFSLAMVFLLSMSQIRKIMIPISILQDATEKISKGAFGHRAEIESGDEFQDLGASFNLMSRKLQEGQALLVRAAKMSAMGQMAAGIVHEIKQPLTAIYGLIQLAMIEVTSGKTRERLETMMGAVERLNEIAGKFGALYQQTEEKFERISLEVVLDRVYPLFAHQFSMKKIQCTVETAEDLPPVFGDEKGLQQVLSNLLINAMDALAEKGGDEPRIRIKTFSSDDKVFLEVADNGCGISDEALSHIFDPFYTTKGGDKGTGLGLAIIESILHKHHATTRVESEVGAGTKFTIAFPALSGEEA